MVLTEKQEQGLKIAVQRFKEGKRYTVISGYAGSGKSTLVRFIIEALGINKDGVGYATYTGKAAEVLRKKGNANAITLHKLLYDSVPRPDGTFFRRKKQFLDFKIVVADECSMIPQDMVDQLSSYRGVYTIYLGDPFQIPPIDPKTANHLLDNPHCFLNEIMRQAAESEIIRVSMDIRNGKPLSYMDGNEVKIYPKEELNTGMLQWAEQIIVGTNKKRDAINKQMREILGKGDKPSEGDKLICCRNYWDHCSTNGNPIINGSIGYLHNPYESFISFPSFITNKIVDTVEGQFICGEDEYEICADKKLIMTGEKTLDSKLEYKIGKVMKNQYLLPLEFEYGYAITGHRAQGSQWDKVLVVEERFPFEKVEHARWLYTCVTRAAEKLVLIR